MDPSGGSSSSLTGSFRSVIRWGTPQTLRPFWHPQPGRGRERQGSTSNDKWIYTPRSLLNLSRQIGNSVRPLSGIFRAFSCNIQYHRLTISGNILFERSAIQLDYASIGEIMKLE